MRYVNEPRTASRRIPQYVRQLPVGQRIKWARQEARLSHDRLVERLGRSNRGHLIKIEGGLHTPKRDLRDAIADATGVPRDLFVEDDEDESESMASVLLRQAIDAAVRDALRRHGVEVAA